jgi:DNA (cytosine-5)-methyltransferase 1
MSAYYNEIDPFAAAWLRNLIAAGHIAPGDVDERSIREVSGDDLRGYRQCHFFAGIGVWSYALRGAGWADDAPVWTGSCPCQPFSAAGKRRGASDDRHLWPEFFRLIRQCRPAIVLGEQVAGKAGYGWWDAVSADLETEDYAGAAADLAAAGAGAPHIRQRLLWMAYRNGARLEIVSEQSARRERQAVERSGEAERLEHTTGERYGAHDLDPFAGRGEFAARQADSAHAAEDGWPGPLDGFWRDADWLKCTDARWRPVEPGTQPLASGIAGRVGRLRAYGNAMCAPLVVAFIQAAREALEDVRAA